MITNSLNLNINIQFQKIIWLGIPLFVILIIFFIGAVAETNRAPFDLAEAESELVSGFMTEHAAVIFVFFFLSEYSSIVLMSSLTAILFFGGYHCTEIFENNSVLSIQSIILGLKTCAFCFLFVWFRATLPRLRYDQLMLFCWTGMLPIAIAFTVLIPSLLIAFDYVPFV